MEQLNNKSNENYDESSKKFMIGGVIFLAIVIIICIMIIAFNKVTPMEPPVVRNMRTTDDSGNEQLDAMKLRMLKNRMDFLKSCIDSDNREKWDKWQIDDNIKDDWKPYIYYNDQNKLKEIQRSVILMAQLDGIISKFEKMCVESDMFNSEIKQFKKNKITLKVNKKLEEESEEELFNGSGRELNSSSGESSSSSESDCESSSESDSSSKKRNKLKKIFQ